MGRHKADQCKNGHPLIKETAYIRPNGTRECKICSCARSNKSLTLRYRTDPIFREAQKAYSRNRYHRLKENTK